MPADIADDPIALVRAFLAAMEARDLASARGLMAEEAVIDFPGAPGLEGLDAVVAWAAPRYRAVRKTYSGFDVARGEAGPVVYARGVLSGQWPDGTAFAGVRFIDRFALVGGRIARHEVWNDLGEARASRGG